MDYVFMFRERANEFRRLLANTNYADNLERFVGDVRSQCTRLLIEAIDADLLHEYWHPGDRPETIPARDADGNVMFEPAPPLTARQREILVKATESHYATLKGSLTAEEKQHLKNLKAGRTTKRVRKSDDKLDRSDLAILWWVAVSRLYSAKKSAFPENALLDDLSSCSDMIPAASPRPTNLDPLDAIDKLQRRISTYASACDYLSSIIEAKTGGPIGKGRTQSNKSPAKGQRGERATPAMRKTVRTGKAGAPRKYTWPQTVEVIKAYNAWKKKNPAKKQAVFDGENKLGAGGISNAQNRVRELLSRFKKSKLAADKFEIGVDLPERTIDLIRSLKQK